MNGWMYRWKEKKIQNQKKHMAKYLALSSFRSSWKTKRIEEEEEEEELAHRYSLDIQQENDTWKNSISHWRSSWIQAASRTKGYFNVRGLEKHAMSVSVCEWMRENHLQDVRAATTKSEKKRLEEEI